MEFLLLLIFWVLIVVPALAVTLAIMLAPLSVFVFAPAAAISLYVMALDESRYRPLDAHFPQRIKRLSAKAKPKAQEIIDHELDRAA